MTATRTFAATLLTIALVYMGNGWGAPVEPVEAVKEGGLDCWSQVTIKRFHDADTIPQCDIHLPYGITIRDASIRAAEYDAKEVTRTRQTVKISDTELKEGKQAAKEFADLCNSGTLYVAPPIGNSHDPYGRLLGRLRVVQGFKVIEVKTYAAEHGWCRK